MNFVEPKTIEEAKARDTQLVATIMRIEKQFQDLNSAKKKMYLPDYDAQRNKLSLAKEYAVREKKFLREWIRKANIEARRRISAGQADTNRGDMMSQCINAVHTLGEYIDSLEIRLREALAENEKLKGELAKYVVTAPSDSVDVWRDGYTHADQSDI
jgi:hypothetical protein